MSSVTSANATTVANVATSSVKTLEQLSAPSIKQAPTDAEVIAKVLSTEFKPSNANPDF